MPKATELNYHPKKRERTRAAFTQEELNRLFEAAKADGSRSLALLRFYVHTACRSSTACELLRADVWNEDSQTCFPTGTVLEKFGVRYCFAIDSELASSLAVHITSSPKSRFVFPTPKKPEKRLNYGMVNFWFQSICKRANVQGDHCFVHALRRTVATILFEAGNKLEDIQSFIGHRSIGMTQHYIERNAATISARLCIPWLRPATAGLHPEF